MRVLVTGGSGFIAGHVIDALLARGDRVVTLDHFFTDRHYQPREALEGVFVGSVTDARVVDEAVARSDAVIHLAGVLGTSETVNNPLPAVETNIIGGLNVFQAMRAHGKPGVYIAVGNHWMNNSYSITKTTAERFALMFNAEHGTSIAVVRALNAYGPRQKAEPVRKIMPNFILPALRGEKIRIFGDGDQRMDMIYVADVARILVAAMDRAIAPDFGSPAGPRDRYFPVDLSKHIFAAGTGKAPSVNHIAEEVCKACGRDPAEVIEHVPMRAGETPGAVVVGDPSTLRPLGIDEFGLTSLRDGIAATVEYYRSTL